MQHIKVTECPTGLVFHIKAVHWTLQENRWRFRFIPSADSRRNRPHRVTNAYRLAHNV